MENNSLENLIRCVKEGDRKAFENVFKGTYEEISAEFNGDSNKIAAAYNRMISTISDITGEEDFDKWIDNAIEYASSANIEKGKKISQKAVYKNVMSSDSARALFHGIIINDEEKTVASPAEEKKEEEKKTELPSFTKKQKQVFCIIIALLIVAVVAFGISNTGGKKPGTYSGVEKTTLPGEKVVDDDKEDYSNLEGLCIYSPDGESVYFSSDGCVRKMDKDGSNEVVITHGNAYSMTLKDKLLYFIAGGTIYCINTEDDQPVNQVKSKGNLLCYLDKFYTIDTNNGIVYSLKDDLSVESTMTVKANRIKYKKGYIYYYQQGSNNLIRQKVASPLGKEQILVDGKENNGMCFGYQINSGKCVVPTFESDNNGDLNIYDMKKKETKSLRLDHFFEDFALVGGNSIIYSSHKFGTTICDIDGGNSRLLDQACLYFVNSSGCYYAFNNLLSGKTLLYSTRSGKFEYTINADVDSMEILGDFVIYNCDGKISKGRLSEMKNEA